MSSNANSTQQKKPRKVDSPVHAPIPTPNTTPENPKGAKKQLILHIGAPKAGSSALQDFFYLNAKSLRENGINYLKNSILSSDQIGCTGNGGRLLEWCTDAIYSEDEPQDMLVNYFGSFNKAICSHEDFYEVPLAAWVRLRDLCEVNEITLLIVCFIRNVYGAYLSNYNYFVKTRGESRDFTNFALHTNCWGLGALKILPDVLQRDQIQVIHYDSQLNVAQSFLDAADLDISSPDNPLRIVNRSLSDRELRMLVELNRVLGSRYSETVSKILISANPTISEPRQVDHRVADLLTERHARDLRWLNEAYFGGNQIVSVAGETLENAARHAPTDNSDKAGKNEECNDVETLVLRWALGELAEFTRKPQADVKRLLLKAVGEALTRAAKSQYANSPELPPDFNVCGYLLRNIDVLFSKTDPFEHYLSCGRAEKRVWALGPTILVRTVGPIYEDM